jgi:hypothetical protein
MSGFQRMVQWFVAPVGATRSGVRRAGVRSTLVGLAIVAVGFAISIRDARAEQPWVVGGWNLLLTALVMGGYVLSAQGLYRAISGIARGETAPAGMFRALSIGYGLLAFGGFFATAFALFALSTLPPPPEPAPERARRQWEVRLPEPGESEVRYDLGDGAVLTIRRPGADEARFRFSVDAGLSPSD